MYWDIHYLFIMGGKFFTINKILSGCTYLAAFLCFGGGLSLFKITNTGQFLLTVNQIRIDSLVSIDLLCLAAALLLESVYFYLDPHKIFSTL
jgi:hypothetical protein